MENLIDNHIHLQDRAFGADLEDVLARSRSAGVRAWAVNGTSPEDWPDVAGLTERIAGVVPCFGLHPWFVNKWKTRDWQTDLAGYLENENAAVGEIGLDRWIRDYDLDAQLSALRRQMELARELARPVSIHCLRAWESLLPELQRVCPLPRDFLIHGFGGHPELIPQLTRLGGFISFAGSVLEERRTRSREALRRVPADRLLVETDAPDMPPPPEFRTEPQQTFEGRYRNHPANLPAIVTGMAKIRNEDPQALRDQLGANTDRFWRDFL